MKNSKNLLAGLIVTRVQEKDIYAEESNVSIRRKERSMLICMLVLEVLEEKKLKKADLARLLGVTSQQVNKWLTGRQNLTLETICRMEIALESDLILVPFKSKVRAEIGIAGLTSNDHLVARRSFGTRRIKQGRNSSPVLATGIAVRETVIAHEVFFRVFKFTKCFEK